MKTILSILAAAITPAAFAADYSVFRVCEDQHVIRTSDGAEAGHVEYIVVDPGSGEVVSTVVTGGVVGPRFVAVPFSSMEFSAGNEIALTQITRERLVSAPVIERTQITRNVIQPTTIDRTYNYFGVRAGEGTARTRVQQSTGVDTQSTTTNQTQPTDRSTVTRGAAQGTAQPGSANTTEKQSQSTAERRRRARQQGQNPSAIGEKTQEQSGAATGTANEKATQGTEPSKPGPAEEKATQHSNRSNEQGEAHEPGTRSERLRGELKRRADERQGGEANRPAEGQTAGQSSELNRPSEHQGGEATRSSEEARNHEKSGSNQKEVSEQPTSTKGSHHKKDKHSSEESNR